MKPLNLTAEQLAEVRTSPLSGVELAKRLGVSEKTISRIRRGEWRDLGPLPQGTGEGVVVQPLGPWE
jgi:transcriptional regulator with XRE-family HTH domain